MLIAPLNWGIGHASRCIPIINKVIENNFEPIIASDGESLLLLRSEFPDLRFFELPSYKISYQKKGKSFFLKIISQLPHIFKTIRKENNIIQHIVEQENVSGIISDNRLGVYSTVIPSVYITHQITILSGITSSFISKIHQHFIKKFDECWVPDTNEATNFTGKMSSFKMNNFIVKHIGILSRFSYQKEIQSVDYLILLSGPEPQRSYLEDILMREFKKTAKKVVMVLGKIEKERIQKKVSENIEIINFVLTSELYELVSKSNVVIARSGYSTVMDLAVLHKKAFFIPTPGQYEQEYLAKRLKQLKIAPYAQQHTFRFEMIEEVNKYKGFENYCSTIDSNLFNLFKGE